MSSNAEVEEFAQRLYKEVFDFWRSYEGQYPTWDYAYRVLYSPPKYQPDLMIIGFNPGGDASRVLPGHFETWPTEHDYFTQGWPLAKKMRSLFASIDLLPALRDSIKTNLIFFRTPRIDGSKSSPEKAGWNDLPEKVRLELERFSAEKVHEMIRVFQPKLILAEGMKTFDALANQVHETQRIKGRRLFAKGRVNGTPVIGLIHPSGAQVSTEDWKTIMDRVRQEIMSGGKE